MTDPQDAQRRYEEELRRYRSGAPAVQHAAYHATGSVPPGTYGAPPPRPQQHAPSAPYQHHPPQQQQQQHSQYAQQQQQYASQQQYALHQQQQRSGYVPASTPAAQLPPHYQAAPVTMPQQQQQQQYASQRALAPYTSAAAYAPADAPPPYQLATALPSAFQPQQSHAAQSVSAFQERLLHQYQYLQENSVAPHQPYGSPSGGAVAAVSASASAARPAVPARDAAHAAAAAQTAANKKVLREGLLKFSLTASNYNTHWFVLHPDFLACYDPESFAPLWNITLWGASSTVRGSSFVVMSSYGQKFHFLAPSDAEASGWAEAFRRAPTRIARVQQAPHVAPQPVHQAPAPVAASTYATNANGNVSAAAYSSALPPTQRMGVHCHNCKKLFDAPVGHPIVSCAFCYARNQVPVTAPPPVAAAPRRVRVACHACRFVFEANAAPPAAPTSAMAVCPRCNSRNQLPLAATLSAQQAPVPQRTVAQVPKNPAAYAAPSAVAPAPLAPSASAPALTAAAPVAAPTTSAPVAAAPKGKSFSISGLFSSAGSFFETVPDTPEEQRAKAVAAWKKAVLAGHNAGNADVVKLSQELRPLIASPHSVGEDLEQFSIIFNKLDMPCDVGYFSAAKDQVLQEIAKHTEVLYNEFPDLAETDDFDEIVHSAICAILFPPIHTHITAFYRHQYQAEDAALLTHLEKFLTVTPLHLGVKQKFWLLKGVGGGAKATSLASLPSLEEQEKSRQAEEEDEDELLPPYYHAIDRMKVLTARKTPADKLRCLVEVGRLICECITKFYGSRGGQLEVVSADDLVPLTSYVMIKSGLRHLYSESMLMQDYMSERSAMGAAGYSLATLQTCIAFVQSLKMEEIEVNVRLQMQEFNLNATPPVSRNLNADELSSLKQQAGQQLQQQPSDASSPPSPRPNLFSLPPLAPLPISLPALAAPSPQLADDDEVGSEPSAAEVQPVSTPPPPPPQQQQQQPSPSVPVGDEPVSALLAPLPPGDAPLLPPQLPPPSAAASADTDMFKRLAALYLAPSNP